MPLSTRLTGAMIRSPKESAEVGAYTRKALPGYDVRELLLLRNRFWLTFEVLKKPSFWFT